MAKQKNRNKKVGSSVLVGRDVNGLVLTGQVDGNVNLQVGGAADPCPDLNLRIARQLNFPTQGVSGVIGLVGAFASIAAFFGLTLWPAQPLSQWLWLSLSLRLAFVLPAVAAWLGLGAWWLASQQRLSEPKRHVGFTDSEGKRGAAWFIAEGKCPTPRCGGRLRCFGNVVEWVKGKSAWTGGEVERPGKREFVARCSRSERHEYDIDILDIQDLLSEGKDA